MVTGYILQAIGLYEGNTGDKRYREKDCLEFVVTDGARYKKNFQDLADAVYENMDQNDYTLYPCEPNWLYTPCK
jgi:Linalool dehydratase/isomerase